jgi:hypothetical protein
MMFMHKLLLIAETIRKKEPGVNRICVKKAEKFTAANGGALHRGEGRADGHSG